ncbi:MAG: adenylosuccinate lyase [Candidatus Shapirobacteria bacterium]
MSKESTQLMAISPIDGRYAEKVEELSPIMSEGGLIQRRIKAECVYFLMLSDYGITRKLTSFERKLIEKVISKGITLKDMMRIKELEKEKNHDVKAVESWLVEHFKSTSISDLVDYFHFCLTSEDINNISYRLQLKDAKDEIIVPKIDEIIDSLMKMAIELSRMPMLGRTHGQAAVPTTVGKELSNFAVRLNKENRKLEKFMLTGKINGAVGNYNAINFIAPNINLFPFSETYVSRLGLELNLFTTQINAPEDIVECLQILQRINGILVDLCQDMWRYISDDWFKQQKKAGEVGSSTMPQKVNPIDFENGEANLQMANSIISGFVNKLQISRLQRDLTDSSTLRNLGTILAHILVACKSTMKGLSKVSLNEEATSAALAKNWAILSEPVQLILKKYSNVEDAYSLVKDFFRGEYIFKKEYQEYIGTLPLESDIKERLMGLTPVNYIGIAPELVEEADYQIKKSRK